VGKLDRSGNNPQAIQDRISGQNQNPVWFVLFYFSGILSCPYGAGPLLRLWTNLVRLAVKENPKDPLMCVAMAAKANAISDETIPGSDRA
jgi:hypothetical protein